MSRKPIIVDGVDVSGCVYRAEEKCILKDDECCFFPNCDYKNWQRKEQECEFLKNITTLQSKDIHDKKQQLNQLKAENEKMEKGYIELTEIVSPYIDDFTGYNEELKGFDIVLCVKELMQQLDRLKEEVEKQRALKQTYLTCYKTKHGDVKGKLFKYERYKEALQNIKEIVIKTGIDHKWDMRFQRWKTEILQKISEVEND